MHLTTTKRRGHEFQRSRWVNGRVWKEEKEGGKLCNYITSKNKKIIMNKTLFELLNHTHKTFLFMAHCQPAQVSRYLQ